MVLRLKGQKEAPPRLAKGREFYSSGADSIVMK